MIVDFHTHIFPPHIGKNRSAFLDRDPAFAGLYNSPKAKMATAEEVIAAMDEVGIDVSVVLNIGWASPELCSETNDYILESISRYPGRLVGFCAIQPNSLEHALNEIERCARGGIRGIGELRPDDQGFDLTNKEAMSPIAEALQKHDLLFLTHASEPVGHTYPGKGNVTPDVLYPFLCNFPELKVVLAHWGGGLPLYALMPEVAKALANTFFDTAATPFLYRPQIFEQVSQIIGANKILFGTDYPLMPQARVIDQIQSTRLSPEYKSMILGGNAAELLNLF